MDPLKFDLTQNVLIMIDLDLGILHPGSRSTSTPAETTEFKTRSWPIRTRLELSFTVTPYLNEIFPSLALLVSCLVEAWGAARIICFGSAAGI